MAEVRAEMVGTVWKVVVEPGARVNAGDTIVILESMKMEIPVTTPVAGTVKEIKVKPEDFVQEGDVVAIVE